jgi:hypothetical protein
MPAGRFLGKYTNESDAESVLHKESEVLHPHVCDLSLKTVTHASTSTVQNTYLKPVSPPKSPQSP